MKKILAYLSVAFVSILLTGCISIPLGDGGKVEVSKDGINIDMAEETEVEAVEEKPTEEENLTKAGEEGTEDIVPATSDTKKIHRA